MRQQILGRPTRRAYSGLLRARQDRLWGIVNGIDMDVWNPATDAALAAPFDDRSLEKRTILKLVRQNSFQQVQVRKSLGLLSGRSRHNKNRKHRRRQTSFQRFGK